MLKRGLIASAFFGLVFFIWLRSQQLTLSFYVLYPSVWVPVLYFFDGPHRWWSAVLGSCAIALGVLFVATHPSPEMFWIFLSAVGLFLMFWLYRRRWQTLLGLTTAALESALMDLDRLKGMHQSRLDSLHHLEKQVSSLLDLFEIARDFNVCLGFREIADTLYRKVMPELPFQEMNLIRIKQDAEGSLQTENFIVASQGVETKEEELGTDGREDLAAIQSSKRMEKRGPKWVFPLLDEAHATVFAVVRDAKEEDLAKFEVLAAYLSLQAKKVDLYEAVKELAIRDGLTGVFVRRHLLERCEEELKRCIRYDLPLSLLMLDIDHFKRYNDEHGHLAGDATLKQVANLLRENLRKVDIIGRYGGEEFVVVLPETNRTGAQEVAERLRSAVARHHFKVYNEDTRVTISLGGTLFREDIAERLPAKKGFAGR